MVSKETPRAYLQEKYNFTEDQAFDAFECMFYDWKEFRIAGYHFIRTETEEHVEDGRIDTLWLYAIHRHLRLIK